MNLAFWESLILFSYLEGILKITQCEQNEVHGLGFMYYVKPSDAILDILA